MGLRAAGAAVALVLAVASLGGAARAAAQPEIYSDVCYHDETGDQLGSELVVWRRPEGPRVRFTLCDGVCKGPEPVVEARLRGDRLTFTVREQPEYGHGRPAPPTIMHFAADLGARSAKVRQVGDKAADRLPRRGRYFVPARVWGDCR
jgi:hypothetical protein